MHKDTHSKDYVYNFGGFSSVHMLQIKTTLLNLTELSKGMEKQNLFKDKIILKGRKTILA